MTLEEKLLELRNSGGVTRAHIIDLLKFIGKPNEKREEKVDAVKQLNLENPQGYRIEDDLESYKEF